MSKKNKPQQSFQISSISPEDYRQQTRKSAMVLIAVFATSAMLLSTVLVMLFGGQGDSNFKWNFSGVILGLLFTIALLNAVFKKQKFMRASVYGWHLKRSLMSVTNIMHHVKAAAAQNDETAMKTLRFYHLGLLHMHKLDGNSSGEDIELVREMNDLQQQMQDANIDCEQTTLLPEWIDYIKQLNKKP